MYALLITLGQWLIEALLYRVADVFYGTSARHTRSWRLFLIRLLFGLSVTATALGLAEPQWLWLESFLRLDILFAIALLSTTFLGLVVMIGEVGRGARLIGYGAVGIVIALWFWLFVSIF